VDLYDNECLSTNGEELVASICDEIMPTTNVDLKAFHLNKPRVPGFSTPTGLFMLCTPRSSHLFFHPRGLTGGDSPRSAPSMYGRATSVVHRWWVETGTAAWGTRDSVGFRNFTLPAQVRREYRVFVASIIASYKPHSRDSTDTGVFHPPQVLFVCTSFRIHSTHHFHRMHRTHCTHRARRAHNSNHEYDESHVLQCIGREYLCEMSTVR
jgi:hypothetical protein